MRRAASARFVAAPLIPDAVGKSRISLAIPCSGACCQFKKITFAGMERYMSRGGSLVNEPSPGSGRQRWKQEDREATSPKPALAELVVQKEQATRGGERGMNYAGEVSVAASSPGSNRHHRTPSPVPSPMNRIRRRFWLRFRELIVSCSRRLGS